MANINAGPFTTRPEIDGTFGVVASTHWIGTAVGMGDPGARRQRLRCRHRHGLHAAGGGAAPVRARRRRAGDALRRQGEQAHRRVRPGPGAGRRHHRPLSRPPRPRHRPRHRAAAGLRAGHVRDLHDDPARLRHACGCATCWSRPSATPRNGHPLVERACATIATVEELFREHWPTSAAVYLPGGKVPAPGHAVHQRQRTPRPTSASSRRPRPAAAGARRRSSGRGAPGARASSPRRSTPSAAPTR